MSNTHSQYHAATSDPNLNEWVWGFVHQNPAAVSRWLATPRAQDILAGRTLGDLYQQGILGEFYVDEVMHMAGDPAAVGAKSREEVLQAFGASPEWYAGMSALRAEHEAYRTSADLARDVAARLAKDDKHPRDERERERLDARIADEYGLDLGAPGGPETTRRGEVAEAYDAHAPKSGPALVRDVQRLQAALQGGTLTREQRPRAERALQKMLVALDREAIRTALRNGQIDIGHARALDRTVDKVAMLAGAMRPFTGSEREKKTQLAYERALEKEAAARGELAPPKEFYIAGEDGMSVAGLPPEQARALEHVMPSADMPAFTVEERKAVRGDRKDAVRLAYAEKMWQADVDEALARDAEEREEREQRFADGEATSRDAVARAYDQVEGTGRPALRHWMDLHLAREEESAARDAMLRSAHEPTPAPEEPARSPSSGGSRAAAERAYDAVTSHQQ